MKGKRSIKVKKDDEKIRLDLFLALHNNDLTRSGIKKEIDNNNVKVNDQVEFHANYKVKEGDIIQLEISARENTEIVPTNLPLDVLYEDEHLVVIDKHAGMTVHPGNSDDTRTVVNAILFRYKELEDVGTRIRSGLIHRLDKDTSGVLLIGKTNHALWNYSKQFAERKVSKLYLVIVKGKIPTGLKEKNLVVQNYLGRNPKNRQKFIEVEKGGRFAHSEFSLLGSKDKYHLILARIFTGRTHQIRVHLASLGIPVLGDIKYGNTIDSRMLLHAWKLKIHLLDGSKKVFIAPIPKEFYRYFPKIDEVTTKYKI